MKGRWYKLNSIPKVLIISTEPYNSSSSSRFLDTFFHGWDSNSVAQIYTVDTIPCKGFCLKYYQITDKDILKRIFRMSKTPGRIVDVCEESFVKPKSISTNKKHFITDFLKRKKENILIQCIRSVLWSPKFFFSKDLDEWIRKFNPDIIFSTIGRRRIATVTAYIAEKYSIPVIAYIPDDYYLKYKNSKYLLEKYYGRLIRKALVNVFEDTKYTFFQCELMKKAYIKEFSLHGNAIYFSSSIQPNKDKIRSNAFVYCGSIEYGRWKSLILLGKALNNISNENYIDVYTKIDNSRVKKLLTNSAGIRLHQTIPYSEVVELFSTVQYIIHIEDFSAKSISYTKYSLSTKIADCMASGACTVAFGPRDIGSIDYLFENGSAFICTNPGSLEQELRELLSDSKKQMEIVEKAQILYRKNHNPDINGNTFRQVCLSVLNGETI